ncbi:hypothetical protein NL676_039542 [Syzygium grande]|nr:hypothetical protein NL676_039542 [Syzygium grande]
MRYKGKGNIREYIMELSHLASKLKALKLDLSEDLLGHLVLISLPTQFNQFKVSYNYQKETWSLNELISHCVQEEERLKQDKAEYAYLASTSKDNGHKRKRDKEAANKAPNKKQQKKTDNPEGGDTVRDFGFEEEYVNIPTVTINIDPTSAIGIDQDPIPDLAQDTIVQDNNLMISDNLGSIVGCNPGVGLPSRKDCPALNSCSHLPSPGVTCLLKVKDSSPLKRVPVLQTRIIPQSHREAPPEITSCATGHGFTLAHDRLLVRQFRSSHELQQRGLRRGSGAPWRASQSRPCLLYSNGRPETNPPGIDELLAAFPDAASTPQHTQIPRCRLNIKTGRCFSSDARRLKFSWFKNRNAKERIAAQATADDTAIGPSEREEKLARYYTQKPHGGGHIAGHHGFSSGQTACTSVMAHKLVLA